MSISERAREYLQQVQRVILSPAVKTFDISTTGEAPESEPTCPSVACAIGYAAADPWFIARGITLAPWEIAQRFNGKVMLLDIHLNGILASSDRLSEAFDTPNEVFGLLFGFSHAVRPDDDRLVTPKHVAANIERVLEGEPPVNYRIGLELLDTSPEAIDEIRARVTEAA